MKLNTLSPAKGSKQNSKRVGRGIGSTLGKTCGRGHKGQKSRSGGFHKLGFEGGQMPLQRRVPKIGFTSRKSLLREEVRLHELAQVDGVITLESLKNANLIRKQTKYVKVMHSGKLEKAVTVAKEVAVTKGAQTAIEAAGGKIEA